MAALDFPLVPNTDSEVTTGDITWKWNGYAWYAASQGDDVYLSRVTDDTAKGAITFEQLTTHEAGIKVTGNQLNMTNDAGPIISKSNAEKQYRAILQENRSTGYRGFDASTNTSAAISGELYGFAGGASLGYAPGATRRAAFYGNLTTNLPENYNIYIQGDAPNHFGGLTEHKGGVKVTGGSCEAVGTGIAGGTNLNLHSTGTIQFNQNCNTQAHISSIGRFQKNMENLADTTTGIGIRAHGAIPTGVGSTEISLFNAQAQVVAGHTSPKISGFKSQPNNGLASVGDYYGFYHNSQANIAVNTYGFYCQLNEGTGSTYSFYSTGSAPSYFEGAVKIGNANISVEASERLATNYVIKQIRGSEGPSTRFYLGPVADAGLGNAVSTIEITASGAAFNNTSDYRLKSNIVDLPSATDAIKALRPVSFTMRGVDNIKGFVAHELQEVLPEAVTGTKDGVEPIGTLTDWDGAELQTDVIEPPAEDLTYEDQVEVTPYVAPVEATYDEEGNELTPYVEEVQATYETVTRTRTWNATGTRDAYQGVSQTKLIPILTKALQEALDRIEQLESNTLQLLYSTFADLPNASDHHGKVAHVHDEGALYFAHAGNWVKLQNA